MKRLMGILVLLMSGFALSQSTDLRFKNGVELLDTLETATKVSSRNSEIRNFFLARSDKFSRFGRFSEISPVGLAATWGLSALFCESLVANDLKKLPKDRWVHASVDFSLPVESALNHSVRMEIYSIYSEIFWLRKPMPSELALSEDFFLSLVEDMSPHENSTNTMLTVLCSTYAASFNSLVAY